MTNQVGIQGVTLRSMWFVVSVGGSRLTVTTLWLQLLLQFLVNRFET